MNIPHSISLLFAACTVITSLAFADSPAMMDSLENSNIEPVFMDNEMDARPAAEDSVSEKNIPAAPKALNEPEKTETVTTGTILNQPVNAYKPMLMRKLDFPRRGMTEDKVKNELGRPTEIKSAIGQPPISQWVYDDRIVYFEYAKVLHVVAK